MAKKFFTRLLVAAAIIVVVIPGIVDHQHLQGRDLGIQKKHMTPPDWGSWLIQWNRELLKYLDFARRSHSPEDDLTSEVVASGWLGYPGAREDQIARLEARLGKRLPPSYRAFLRASNGFRMPGTFVSRLLPIERVEWFRVRNQETIDLWKSNDLEDLSDTLLISAPDSFTRRHFLLNPRVVRPDGEWEAISFWPGGAECRQFPSFRELMQDERKGFLLVEEIYAGRMHPDDDLQVVVAKFPNLIKKFEDEEQRGVSPPNQEMYEAIMDHLIHGRNQDAVKQFSENEEVINEAPSPAKPRVAKTQKKSDSRLSYRLEAVNPAINEVRPDSRKSEANYRKYLEYRDGFIEGLRSAKSRVVEIQTKSNQPEVIYRELILLERELNKKYLEYARNNPGVDDYRSNLHDRETGFSKGCVMAAGVIKIFMNEPPAVSWEALKTRAVESTLPKYSSAQSASATVVIIVNVHGVVTRAYHRDGDEGLGRVVAQALKQWRFHPPVVNNHGIDQSCEVSARLVAGEIALS